LLTSETLKAKARTEKTSKLKNKIQKSRHKLREVNPGKYTVLIACTKTEVLQYLLEFLQTSVKYLMCLTQHSPVMLCFFQLHHWSLNIFSFLQFEEK